LSGPKSSNIDYADVEAPPESPKKAPLPRVFLDLSKDDKEFGRLSF